MIISGSSQGQGIFLINSAHDIPSAHNTELMAQRWPHFWLHPVPSKVHGSSLPHPWMQVWPPHLRSHHQRWAPSHLHLRSVNHRIAILNNLADEGLVRFCVNEYTTDPEKINDNMMHVCNYDVNKHSEKFTPNEDPLQPEGHKWTWAWQLSFPTHCFLIRLTGLWKYLASEREKPQIDGCLTIPQIWEKVTVSSFRLFSCLQIEDVVVKSILCGLSSFRGDGQNVQQFDDSKPMGPAFNAQLDKVKVKLELEKMSDCRAG